MAAGQKFRELLELFLDAEVEFLVVGATAAVLGGAPLTTFDLDVVFEPSPDNRARLLGALREIDAVIESKMATDREKDRAALPLLREVLRQRAKS